jgi:hypothetical protein
LAATTLERIDNEEGDGDEDEEWASESATSSSYMEAKYVYKIICAILFMIYFIQDLKQWTLYTFYRFWQLKIIFFNLKGLIILRCRNPSSRQIHLKQLQSLSIAERRPRFPANKWRWIRNPHDCSFKMIYGSTGILRSPKTN